MSDFGIKVTSKGNNYDSAALKDQLLNTKYPFAKLDITNKNSFQNIRLIFNNDLPYNGDGSERVTEIYKFKHNAVDGKGNKIIPSFWALVKNNNASAGSQPYFTGNGQIAATSSDSYVTLSIQVDVDYVYFIATKAWYPPSGDANPTVVGTILQIRTYVFVEGLGF